MNECQKYGWDASPVFIALMVHHCRAAALAFNPTSVRLEQFITTQCQELNVPMAAMTEFGTIAKSAWPIDSVRKGHPAISRPFVRVESEAGKGMPCCLFQKFSGSYLALICCNLGRLVP